MFVVKVTSIKPMLYHLNTNELLLDHAVQSIVTCILFNQFRVTVTLATQLIAFGEHIPGTCLGVSIYSNKLFPRF
jgi:hypothetical protein